MLADYTVRLITGNARRVLGTNSWPPQDAKGGDPRERSLELYGALPMCAWTSASGRAGERICSPLADLPPRELNQRAPHICWIVYLNFAVHWHELRQTPATRCSQPRSSSYTPAHDAATSMANIHGEGPPTGAQQPANALSQGSVRKHGSTLLVLTCLGDHEWAVVSYVKDFT